MNFFVILILFHGIFLVQSDENHPTKIQLCPEKEGEGGELPRAWRVNVENPEIEIIPPRKDCPPESDVRMEFKLGSNPRYREGSNFLSKRGKVIIQDTIILPEHYCIKSSYAENGMEIVTISYLYCSIPDCQDPSIFCINMCLEPNWAFRPDRFPKLSDHILELEDWSPPIKTQYEIPPYLHKMYSLSNCESRDLAFYTDTYKRPYPSNFTRLKIIESKSDLNDMVYIARSPTNVKEWTLISDPWCVGPVLDQYGTFSGNWAAMVCESKPKINNNTPQRPQLSNYPRDLAELEANSRNPNFDSSNWLPNPGLMGLNNAPNSFESTTTPRSIKCPTGDKDKPRIVHPGGAYSYRAPTVLPATDGKSSNVTITATKGPNDIVYMYATNAFFHGLTALVYLLLWDKLDLYGYLVLAMTAAFASALGMQASVLDNDIEQYWTPESMPCIIRAIILNFMIICAFSWLLMIAYNFWSQLDSLTTKIARWPPLKLFLAYGFLAFGLPLAVVTTGRMKDISFMEGENNTGITYQCDRLGFYITGGAGYGVFSCSLLESAMGPYLYYIEIGIMAAMWIFMGLTSRNLSQIAEKSRKITTLENGFQVFRKVLIIITITASIEIFSWANKSTGNEWYCTFLKKINSCAGLPIFLVFVWNKDKLDQLAEKWPFLEGLRDRLVGISETVNKVQGFSRVSKMVRGGKKGPKEGAAMSIDEENPRPKKMVKKPRMPPSYDEIEVTEKGAKLQKNVENREKMENQNRNKAPSGDEEYRRETPSGDEEDPNSIEIDERNDIENDEKFDSDEENSPKK